MSSNVSGRGRPSSTQPREPSPHGRGPSQPPQVPRMETPSGDIGLREIWQLLCNMQEQIMSLQEQGTATENIVVELEERVQQINGDTKGIIGQLVDLQNRGTHTLERRPQATEETPCAPPTTIHSPLASRTTRKPTFLDLPFSYGAAKHESPTQSRRSTPDTGRAPKPPKMREPEDFDGTRGRVAKQWMTKAAIWAQIQLPAYENNEQAIVMRLLTLMKTGKAADWAQPHLEQLAQQSPTAFQSIKDFARAFAEAFGEPDAARTAARQIEALKQEGSIHDYTTAFENLKADLDWNEPAMMSQYERGLQHRIKVQLALKDPYPTTLQSLQQAAIKIGNTYAELDASRPNKGTSTGSDKKGKGKESTTTTTTTTRTPNPKYVDAEERDKRRAENLCVKCGAPDHIMRACKNGWSKTRLANNKEATTITKKTEVRKETAKVAKVTVEEEEESEESGKE